jgi:hypothetical protein
MKIRDLFENTMPLAIAEIRKADEDPSGWKSFTLDEMISFMEGPKKGKVGRAFAPPGPDVPSSVVDPGPEFKKTSERYPRAAAKYLEWIRVKMENPMSLIGYDKPFVAKSPYDGLMHAHMDDDVSVVYRITGKDPRHIKVYGFYSHEDLGTTRPPKQKVQQIVGTRLKGQIFQENSTT